MADVPDQLVARNVINFVQGQGQLDDAQRGGKMAAGLGDGLGEENADFLRQRAHCVRGQVLDVVRAVDAVKQIMIKRRWLGFPCEATSF